MNGHDKSFAQRIVEHKNRKWQDERNDVYREIYHDALHSDDNMQILPWESQQTVKNKLCNTGQKGHYPPGNHHAIPI